MPFLSAGMQTEGKPLNIHIYCYKVSPNIGGMERLIETLAREFIALGHSVHVVTETLAHADFPFPVHRRPGFLKYLRLARSSDVILTAPLTLTRLPAQLLSGRKIFVSHPDRLGGTGVKAVLSFFKRLASRHLVNIVPSRFMGQFFHDPKVILNAYDDTAFFPPQDSRRRKGVIFVGRLTPPKGCDLLVEAFARIAGDHPDHDLTLVGGGSSADDLARQAARLGIADRVRFAGTVRGAGLTELMQDHAVMVVPSIMEEPFGIVALEGLACGCRMIVSRTGGLPEAVGPFGRMFASGDVAELASCLREALQHENTDEENARIQAYLADFRPEAIARQFLAVLGGGKP